MKNLKNLAICVLLCLHGMLAWAQTNTYNILDQATASITGGTINGAVIGGTTPASGTFTTLTATGNFTSQSQAGFAMSGRSLQSPMQVSSSAASLQILQRYENFNTGASIAAIGFQVAGGAETRVAKAGIGMVRNGAQGQGDLAFYNQNSSATTDFTTADEWARLTHAGKFLIGYTLDQGGGQPLQVNGGGAFNGTVGVTNITATGLTASSIVCTDGSKTLSSSCTGYTPVLSGTTSSIGGGALAAGACTSGTVSVTNSTTAMSVVASPVTYPGDGIIWHAYVSSAGTVTVKVCTILAATPTASNYNVRVLQ